VQQGRIEEALEHLERWVARARRPGALGTLTAERAFEVLYNTARYRALLAELQRRTPEKTE
jgi:hypothetical protein